MAILNKRNKWSLSIGCIGRDLCYTLVSLFLLTYLQYTGLFNTTQFVVMSIVIIACRVWDAINDPMMGTIITNTKTRFGKYRPWVLIGAVLNSIFLVLMFTVRFENGWANVIFIGLSYLLWGMTYTMNDISFWDLLPALTSDKKDRDNLTTSVAVCASIGAFISGGLIPIVTPTRMIEAYKLISIIWAIVFLACQLLVFFGVHDNKHDKFMEPKEDLMTEKDEEKISLKSMVKILFSNKQLMVMAIVVFLYSLGSAILNAFGQNFFYFKFGYLSSSSSSISGGMMMTIFTVIYALGTIISQAIYPTLANKFKRNQLVNVSIITLSIGYLLFFLFANVLNGMLCFIILCILGIFIFIGQGVFYLAMLVMLTNTIEYGEWQTGKNHAAIAFTVRPFMVKLSGAVQYGVVALSLIVCGLFTITENVGDVEVLIGLIKEGDISTYSESLKYLTDLGHDPVVIGSYFLNPDISLLEGLQQYASSLFVANTGSMLGLTASMCLLPVILFVIALFVIKKKYIIDEAMYEKIINEIKERNNG